MVQDVSDQDTTPEAVGEPTRRDFLYLATGMAGLFGAGALAWPFIDQMRPDASALAAASIEVDISSLKKGSSLLVKWRGKPVVIRYRTDEEVKSAEKVPLSELKDPIARNDNLPSDAPATDANRSAGKGKESWFVMIQVCTHLGCIPLGQQGDYGGWFCPCHGSQYDTAGRIRHGPAPYNMEVPPYELTPGKTVKIG